MNTHKKLKAPKYRLLLLITIITVLTCGGAVSATGSVADNADSTQLQLSQNHAGVPASPPTTAEGTFLSIQATEQQSTVHTVGYDVENGTTDNIRDIKAQKVWNRFDTRGEGATIAIIDTGVNTDAHPELEPIEGGWKDFVNGRDTPYDTVDHGTPVAGIIAGEQITEERVAGLPANEDLKGRHYGIAPDVNLIYAQVNKGEFKEKTNEGGNSRRAIEEALDWFSHHEADIDVVLIESSTASTGALDYNKDIIFAIQKLRDQGSVVVVPTGNAGNGTIGSPASVYESFTVGATESNVRFVGGETTDFSSGKKLT